MKKRTKLLVKVIDKSYKGKALTLSFMGGGFGDIYTCKALVDCSYLIKNMISSRDRPFNDSLMV